MHDWIDLYETHFSTFSRRSFVANVGTWPEVVEEISHIIEVSNY